MSIESDFDLLHTLACRIEGALRENRIIQAYDITQQLQQDIETVKARAIAAMKQTTTKGE